jgi:hypothetical protein
MSPAEGRKFAFTVGAAFLVLGAIVWWRGYLTVASVFGALGGTLGVLGLVVPGKLGPVNRAWMGLAHLISKVTTPIFMGIVYFLVITPISLLMRLFGKTPAPRRRSGAATYWIAREPPTPAAVI